MKSFDDKKKKHKASSYELKLSCDELCSGEFRHTGQVPFNFSHSSMQSAWKQCWHGGIVLSVSFGSYSERQIGHVASSILGSLLLSPNTIFGYDSIVGPSKPIIIILDCKEWAWVLLNSRLGTRRRRLIHALILL